MMRAFRRRRIWEVNELNDFPILNDNSQHDSQTIFLANYRNNWTTDQSICKSLQSHWRKLFIEFPRLKI